MEGAMRIGDKLYKTVLVCGVFVLAGLGQAAAATVCKSAVDGIGRDVFKQVATTMATSAWPVKVIALHGVQYANWSNATGKSTTCKQTTTALGANVWTCTVTAKPCILQ